MSIQDPFNSIPPAGLSHPGNLPTEGVVSTGKITAKAPENTTTQKTRSLAASFFANCIRKPIGLIAAIPFVFIAFPLQALFWVGGAVQKRLSGLEFSAAKTFKFSMTYLFGPLQMLVGNERSGQTYRLHDTVLERNQTKGSIILGSVPLSSNAKSIGKLLTKDSNQGYVIDLTEPEEKSNVFGSKPLTADDWAKTPAITYKSAPAPDFSPLNLEMIDNLVEDMHQAVTAGKNVYIHCKAGVGRSATIVAAYLAKHGNENPMTAKEALAFVRSKRSINLNSDQECQIYKYKAMLEIGKLENSDGAESLFTEALALRKENKDKTKSRAALDKTDFEYIKKMNPQLFPDVVRNTLKDFDIPTLRTIQMILRGIDPKEAQKYAKSGDSPDERNNGMPPNTSDKWTVKLQEKIKSNINIPSIFKDYTPSQLYQMTTETLSDKYKSPPTTPNPASSGDSNINMAS